MVDRCGLTTFTPIRSRLIDLPHNHTKHQFRLAHAAMDHVSFKASLTRLRTKPVSVHVGRLDIDLYERPPHEANPVTQPEPEPQQQPPQPPPAPPRGYKLTDRILDGVRVEIGEVRIRLRTLGRRKCPRVGPWSPPDGLWVLRGVRLATVDEEWLEVGDLEEAWAYNKARLKRRRRQRQRQQPQQPEEENYFLFKRLMVESLAFYVLPRRPAAHRYSQAGGSGGSGGHGDGGEGGGDGPRLLVPETPVECRFTVRRPLQDVGRWLGFEMDLRVRLHASCSFYLCAVSICPSITSTSTPTQTHTTPHHITQHSWTASACTFPRGLH